MKFAPVIIKAGIITSALAAFMALPVFVAAKPAPKNSAHTDDPFDFAVSFVAGGGKQSSLTAPGQVSRSFKNANQRQQNLQYFERVSGGTAKSMIDTLSKKYGPPTSIRGNLRVWTIANPQVGSRHSKNITIIVNHDPKGTSSVKLDRDRGGNGRATRAVPRRDAPVKGAVASTDSKKKTRPNDVNRD